MAKAGLDREKIRQTIASDTFETINGKVKFDGVQNTITPTAFLQFQNGTLQLVWPSSFASAKVRAEERLGLTAPAPLQRATRRARPEFHSLSKGEGVASGSRGRRGRPRRLHSMSLLDILFSGQLLFSALVIGTLYALVALGLNLIYGTLRLLNVAHGDLVMLGAYGAFWIFTLAGWSPLAALPLLALGGAHSARSSTGGCFGGCLRGGRRAPQRWKPTRCSCSSGLSILFQNLAAYWFTVTPRAYQYLDQVWRLGEVAMTANRLVALLVAAAVCAGVTLFLRFHALGLALQALIQRREAAFIVGVDVELVQRVSFWLGFASAFVAGGLISMLEPFSPFSGFPFTIAAFVDRHPGRARQSVRGAGGRVRAGRDRDLRRGADLAHLSIGLAVRDVRAGAARVSAGVAGRRLHDEGGRMRPRGVLDARRGRSSSCSRALGAVPHLGSDYATGVALNVVMWIALVESWSVLSALTGYVSLGHAAFYGLGAYVVVLGWDHLPLYLTIPLAGGVAALFAALVGAPVLRVRGAVLRHPHLRHLGADQVCRPGLRDRQRGGQPHPV